MPPSMDAVRLGWNDVRCQVGFDEIAVPMRAVSALSGSCESRLSLLLGAL